MSKLNNPVVVETEFGGRKLSIESGRFAKQAGGSVYIKYGETSALVTAVSDKKPNESLDFFPLTIEFQEKFYASGKIPGGFFKKEARPTDWATLNARMVDRPIRPLFPNGYKNPTQVVITLLSYDGESEPEAIAGLGASAALLISDAPFEKAIATVRVGRVDGKLLINPTVTQLETADISVLVSAHKDAVCMVEGGSQSASEKDVLDAIFYGFDEIKKLIALQEELRSKVGKEKRVFTPPERDEALCAEIEKAAQAGLGKAFANRDKAERYKALDQVKSELANQFFESKGGSSMDAGDADKLKKEISEAFGDAKKNFARKLTLESGKRLDGRAYNEIRQIECEVGLIPRVHGSALFTRGETQALCIVTLGTSEDEQMLDSVLGKRFKKVMLHYNFPPYSVGETGRFGGNSRREIGHGTLAERAIMQIIPEFEKFPYTIRMVSETLESNGSSSMAAVCGNSMALMQAGVPTKQAVAGIAMGMMSEGGKEVILSDILGDEDHLGDMDFKVCGTKDGITSIQMDIKLDGISRELMESALTQAREGRLHILGEMAKAIEAPSEEMSEFAPKIISLKISQERIKDLIGPGGKNIKNIVAVTGVKMDIEDSGKVNIASSDPIATQKAIDMVRELTDDAEIGRIYMGTVVRITDFGAFVNIMPNTDGLVHISELEHRRVNDVRDVVQEGDEVPVKVLDIDRQGKIRLSRKAALPPPVGGAEVETVSERPRPTPSGNPPPVRPRGDSSSN